MKHDPFTGARLTSADTDASKPRLGAPSDKFAMAGLPVKLEDQRQAVMLMLSPPEELRDQPLDVIEAVIANSQQSLMKAIALEIYKSYTSEPLDAAAARNAAEALARHADEVSKRNRTS